MGKQQEHTRVERIEDLLADYPDGLTAGELVNVYQARYGQKLSPHRLGEDVDLSSCILVVSYEPTPDREQKREAFAALQVWEAQRRWSPRRGMQARRRFYAKELERLVYARVAGNSRAHLYALDRALYDKRRGKRQPVCVPRICTKCRTYHNELVPRTDCRTCGETLPA